MSHLLVSLHNAAKLALEHGNKPSCINYERWAVTYRCTADDVREAFKLAENGSRKLPEEVAVTLPKTIQPQEIDE